MSTSFLIVKYSRLFWPESSFVFRRNTRFRRLFYPQILVGRLPFLGSMEPVSRRCFLILAMVERPTFHFGAAFRSDKPLSQSSKIRFRNSVGIGLLNFLRQSSSKCRAERTCREK